MPRIEEHEAAVLEDDVVRYARVKKKAYVRLVTNAGALNLELHCEYVPKTCENFIRLCQKGYYDGTKFHRSIRHFMVRISRFSGLDGFLYSICLSILGSRWRSERRWNRRRVLLGYTLQG